MSQVPKLPEKIPGCDTISCRSYFDWYAKLEAWHKKVFEGAVEVGGGPFRSTEWTFCSDKTYQAISHTALLINIHPLQKEPEMEFEYSADGIVWHPLVPGWEADVSHQYRKPKKEETAEDILKEIVDTLDIKFGAKCDLHGQATSNIYEVDVLAKAKAFLERKK